MNSPLRRDLFSIGYVTRLALLFILYYVTARYGLGFDAVSGFATLVWPPSGIAIAALLLYGHRLWPAIALGAFIVNLQAGAPIYGALGIALGNTLEALTAWYLLKRIFGFDNSFRKLRNVFTFILLAVFSSTLVSATIGTFTLFLTGTVVSFEAFGNTWLAWWTGDILGALIVAPFLIVLSNLRAYRRHPGLNRLPEAVGLMLLTAVSAWVIFFDVFSLGLENTTLIYLIVPLLVWVTVRFEVAGAVTAALIISIISIAGTASGKGPFIWGDLNQNLFFLQVFMASTSVTVLVLSAALSERRVITEELREQKNENAALLQSIGEGVIAVDRNGIVILTNKAAEDMLQVRQEDTVGRHYDTVLRLEDDSRKEIKPLEQPLQVAFASRKIFRNTTTSIPTYYYVRKDGSRFPIALTVSPIVINDTTVGAINVFRDITFEKEIDHAKSEFITIASHQLRTPLATTKWYSEAILTEDLGPLNLEQKQYVKEIYESNERMVQLLNSLLNVFHIELGSYAAPKHPLALTAVADSVITDLGIHAHTKGVLLQKEYADHLPAVLIDKRDAYIIIENLVSNAIKYSPPGKTVTLALNSRQDKVIISVTDHGVGIPPHDQHKLFSKFFRAGNARTMDPNGSGLGLYIVKSIVDHFGGTIHFTSKINAGTTFSVELPAHSA